MALGLRKEENVRRSRLARQRGFSIIELLIILMMMGFVAFFVFGETSKVIRKSRLEGTVNETQTFLNSLTRRAQESHQQIFVRLVGHQLTACQNADGTGVLATQTLPDYIAFHATSLTLVDVNWPQVSSVPMLRCDPRGLTLDPTSGAMVTTEQRMTMTHVDMVSGDLIPRTVYSVRISPLWRCYVARTVQ
jgi:type II secretory pathway pseudopilin PulG